MKRFLLDWRRRRNGPIIAQLTQEFDKHGSAILSDLHAKFNGQFSPEQWEYIEGAFKLYQKRLLHGPISALAEEMPEPHRNTLLEAMMKMFRLER